MKNIRYYIALTLIGALGILSSCYEEDKLNIPKTEYPEPTDELDIFVNQTFLDPYGVAIRYKYVDRYVDPTKRVTPPRRSSVEPMVNFLLDMWVDPYLQVQNGKKFFQNYVPAEMVFIGSLIYNGDGTVTLGTADAGARITLSDVDSVDPDNKTWVFSQLRVIYHEFAHIVHQRYNLPPAFQDISPDGYTSEGSWYVLTDEEALERGFVSPYATSSTNEDFAEMVSHIMYLPTFYDDFINEETNCATAACEARNKGRALIKKKYAAILAHYNQYTGVDLVALRNIIQAKLQ